MRDPSIHIKQSDLIKVLATLFKDGVVKWDLEDMAKCILREAHSMSCTNRSLDASHIKAPRVSQSNLSDAEVMAKYIAITRKRLKHVGVTQIKPGSRDWLVIKDATAKANDFCNDFQLEREPGYTTYLNIAIGRMSRFVIQKLASMYSLVCEIYAASLEISQADSSIRQDMEKGYKIYVQKVLESSGIMTHYDSFPEKMVFFKRAAEQADSLNVTIRLYIEAQFTMMEKMGTYPEPTQLCGEKATLRASKFIKEKRLY